MNPPIQGRIGSGIAHKPNVFLAIFPTPQKFGQGDGGGRDHKMSGAPGPLVGAVLHRSGYGASRTLLKAFASEPSASNKRAPQGALRFE
jgi:hypothetical protein